MPERTTGWKLTIILAQPDRVNELLTPLCDKTSLHLCWCTDDGGPSALMLAHLGISRRAPSFSLPLLERKGGDFDSLLCSSFVLLRPATLPPALLPAPPPPHPPPISPTTTNPKSRNRSP